MKNTDLFIVHREGLDYQIQYEKLKADVLDGIEIPEGVAPGDGKLTIKDSNGNELGSFTANQTAAVDITLPAGFSGNYEDLENKPEIPEIPEVTAPGDGKLTISNADGSEAGVFTANQAGNVTITLPAGFSGDYNDLTNKPEIPEVPEIPDPGDGKLTINNADGSEAGVFTANQSGDVTITLPDGASGEPVHWDDIEGKPNLPEGPPECPSHEMESVDPEDWDWNGWEWEYVDIEVIEESRNFEGTWRYFRMPYGPDALSYKKVGANIKLRTGPDGEWTEGAITAWQHHTFAWKDNPDQKTEYLAFQVNDNEDVNWTWNEISYADCGPIKDGKLTLLNARGREIGEFSANQEDDKVLLIHTDAAHFDQDPPRFPCCLHVKNVRGGQLIFRWDSADSSLGCVEAIGVGNHVNLSNFSRETKRYMSSLMLFGSEPVWDKGTNSYDKSYRCLRYGDFSYPGSHIGGSDYEFNGDNDLGYELIEAAGFNHENLCGTTTSGDFDGRYYNKPRCHIQPVALVKNTGENKEEKPWIEVPNHYEYLVYFWPDINEKHCWIEVTPGTTWELGPLTDTSAKKIWDNFFWFEVDWEGEDKYGNTAPQAGLRYLDVSNATSMEHMFYRQRDMYEAPELRFWNVSKCKNFHAMFEGCKNFDADLSRWNMQSADKISKMFEDCWSFECGRRETFDHGIGRWRMPNITDKSAMNSAFFRCKKLRINAIEWKLSPEVCDPDGYENGPNWGPMGNWCEGISLRLNNGQIANDGESEVPSGGNQQPSPWDDNSGRYAWHAYWKANRFVQNPILGPDKMNGNEQINWRWTKDFDKARKEIWQEYIEWIDEQVLDGKLKSWKSNSTERDNKWQEFKDRDDVLYQENFDPSWGLIDMKSSGSSSRGRLTDPGNNLEGKPAAGWGIPGKYQTMKPTWDNPNFSSYNWKDEWFPANTTVKWTAIEGDITFEDDTARETKMYYNGEVGDVVQAELRLTQSNWEVGEAKGEPVPAPYETQKVFITLVAEEPSDP